MLMEDALSARVAANVFWANGELYEKVRGGEATLLAELGKYVQSKSHAMKVQELSNCLLAGAKLGRAFPEVLPFLSGIAECIPQ